MMYDIYVFWDAFSEFYKSEQCPNHLSILQAIDSWLAKHSKEQLIRVRDFHYLAYCYFSNAVDKKN